MASFQWYPGHMAKAKRAMEANLKLVDLIIELVDARAPLSTRNPDIDTLGRNKKRIVVLNKSDLASEKYNDLWISYFEKAGISAVKMVSKNGTGIRSLKSILADMLAEKAARDAARGIRNRPIRAMAAGIPNVGKSTLINALAGKNVTKTGNKPGVTKGEQWITIGKGLELLDTPGILWPKISDSRASLYMAMIGSMNDDAINNEDLISALIKLLQERYPEIIMDKFGIEENDDIIKALEKTAGKLNLIKKGGEPDLDRAGAILLDSFRSGRLGRITLEFPE